MKKASQYAKDAGLPSLKVASEISGASTQTLNNWLNEKTFVFHSVIEKASKAFKMGKEIEGLLVAQKEIIKGMDKQEMTTNIQEIVGVGRNHEYVLNKDDCYKIIDFIEAQIMARKSGE